MPWTWQRYPDSMKNLPVRVRHKAIEVANALIEDGYDEGRAIPIAIAQAKEWVENHPPRQRKSKEQSSDRPRTKRQSATSSDRAR